jgi:hypothetical protein
MFSLQIKISISRLLMSDLATCQGSDAQSYGAVCYRLGGLWAIQSFKIPGRSTAEYWAARDNSSLSLKRSLPSLTT